METMNYNRDNKKSKKAGIVAFMLFTCIGTASTIYLMSNEPKAKVIGQDMYIPVDSSNVNSNVEIYSEMNVDDITYTSSSKMYSNTKSNFKASINYPEISINSIKQDEINSKILDKFKTRFEKVKSEATSLENKFTYKVTFNEYESKINGHRLVSYTFYERIIDDETGLDTTYKLYGYTIDLATKEILTQEEAANIILGSTYKTIIKDVVKNYAIKNNLFTSANYSYVTTGLEEFYVKNEKLHIMFNVGELGNKKDYLDILVNEI